jgi:hypothetical protein
MTAIRLCGLALVTGTLALAATAAPAAAYLELRLKNTMISSYSVRDPAVDELPTPPMAAPQPGKDAQSGYQHPNLYKNIWLNGIELPSAESQIGKNRILRPRPAIPSAQGLKAR